VLDYNIRSTLTLSISPRFYGWIGVGWCWAARIEVGGGRIWARRPRIGRTELATHGSGLGKMGLGEERASGGRPAPSGRSPVAESAGVGGGSSPLYHG
jgi:hypothetical protein